MKLLRIVATQTTPDANIVVDNCVTDGFSGIAKEICTQLNLDFKDIGYNILSDQTIQSLRAEVSDYIADYLYKHDVR